MAILRGEFATARDYLERGKETSLVRKELFDEALAGIDDARAAQTYQKALDLEHDFRYEAAIAKFQELLERLDCVGARRRVIRLHLKRRAFEFQVVVLRVEARR